MQIDLSIICVAQFLHHSLSMLGMFSPMLGKVHIFYRAGHLERFYSIQFISS